MPLRSHTARKIKTATGAVDLSASAAPTAGQVPIATDDENAEWGDLPGGSPAVIEEADSSVDIVLDGNTQIVVWAKGNYVSIGNETQSASLRQDTVVKDSVNVNMGSGGDRSAFSLMYTEVPAADTYTIDVVTSDGEGIENVKIMIMTFPAP
jgi:hypothetical protein